MALSEYMPYGAPDLLAAAPARMARSTMIASLLVVLLVASLGSLLARQAAPPPETIAEVREFDLSQFLQLRAPAAPPEVVPAAPARTADPHSLAVPRPDVLVPPEDPVRIAPPDGRTGTGPGDAPVFAGESRATGGEPDEPLPGEFVYTDEMPALVRAVEPRYPDLAREAGVEGTVTVRMLVGVDGRVLRAIVAPRGSVPMLDEAALEASRSFVFTPALANGHPVKVWVSQQFRFRLH